MKRRLGPRLPRSGWRRQFKNRTPPKRPAIYARPISGGNNGDAPNAGLVFDEKGVLYGTTNYGGALGKGSVFKLTPPPGGGTPWAMTVLYSFPPLSDGREGYPFPGGLIRDKAGALTIEDGQGPRHPFSDGRSPRLLFAGGRHQLQLKNNTVV